MDVTSCLQVVTDDAIRAETDQAIESDPTGASRRQHRFPPADAARRTTISGGRRRSSQGCRISGAFSLTGFTEWDLVSTTGDVPNTYTVRLKPAQEQA